jgi:hypothetical protein
MNITTKFNYGDKVYFFDSYSMKFGSGIVKGITVQVHNLHSKEEPKTVITYELESCDVGRHNYHERTLFKSIGDLETAILISKSEYQWNNE